MASTLETVPRQPVVPLQGPPGACLVELLIYNGHPFNNHWAYQVISSINPGLGVVIHATGDVRNGFQFEIKRSHDIADTQDPPMKRIPLQWVEGEYFDQTAMLNNGKFVLDDVPVCRFEASVYKIKVPGKSLNTTSDAVASAGNIVKRITQRDCQTWIVESAEQLAKDRIFSMEIASYLRAIQQ